MESLREDFLSYLQAVFVEEQRWVLMVFDVLGIVLFLFPRLAESLVSSVSLVRAIGGVVFLASFLPANFALYRKMAKENLEEQRKSQSFLPKIVDTYRHQLEFFGVILSMDNPSNVSVFVRGLYATLVFSESDAGEFSFWKLLPWVKPEAVMEITVFYPSRDSFSLSTSSWSKLMWSRLNSLRVVLDRYPPKIWVFNRRTDKVTTLESDFEIPRGVDTVLWELVLYIPPQLRESAHGANLIISGIDVKLEMNDRSTYTLKAVFEPRVGFETSSRERVTRLITQ